MTRKDIGLMIKKEREARNLAQWQLAYQLGIRQGHISEIELGRAGRQAIEAHGEAIFKALGIPWNPAIVRSFPLRGAAERPAVPAEPAIHRMSVPGHVRAVAEALLALAAALEEEGK
jgi:transcriptional regulator with XRE-family HTH domain